MLLLMRRAHREMLWDPMAFLHQGNCSVLATVMRSERCACNGSPAVQALWERSGEHSHATDHSSGSKRSSFSWLVTLYVAR